MNLTDRYPGGDTAFRGDSAIWLRSLPGGARVTRAILTLEPVVAPATSAIRFQETFTFGIPTNGELDAATWGVTKTPPGPTIEVDFHSRQTLAAVEGSNLNQASLQMDVGGLYVEVNERGAVRAPQDPLFKVPSDGKLPGLTVSKFKLGPPQPELSPPPNRDISKLTVRSVPTNVNVRLGQMPPFWTQTGELALAASSPDFAAVLNAFLATSQAASGFYTIPFMIHSDTFARLDVTVEVDYVVEQPVLPPHLREATLPYNFSTLPGTSEDLTTATLPRRAIPVAGQTQAQVRGEFQATRIAMGPIGEELGFSSIVASPDCSLAQPFRAGAEIALVGIDLPLGNTQTGLAGMNLAIQSDADGKPSGEALMSADVRVEKPLPGQSSWGSASLPQPFRVLSGVRYWLVLQSRLGQAYWVAAPNRDAEPPLQCSRDNGLSWRVAAAPTTPEPSSALFRLRDAPEHFSVPVQLQIGKGAGAVRRRLDEYAPLGRVEFHFDFAEKLAEHLRTLETAPSCGAGELLINGGFDQPPHDDATRRLFGFDVGSGISIQGRVDLSRGVDLSSERFIALSVGDGPTIRIDCAGADPAHTEAGKVAASINRAMERELASISDEPPTHLTLFSDESSSGTLTLHSWRRATLPAGWQRPVDSMDSRGEIWRVKFPTLFRPTKDKVAVLDQPEVIVVGLEAGPGDSTVLAQCVPVVAGCAYALRFVFANFPSIAVFESSLSQWSRYAQATGAVVTFAGFAALPTEAFGLAGMVGGGIAGQGEAGWSVRWRNVNAQVIRETHRSLTSKEETSTQLVNFTDQIPDDFQPVLRYDTAKALLIFLGVMSLHEKEQLRRLFPENKSFQNAIDELFRRSQVLAAPEEIRLVAPDGAVEAEIRFSQLSAGFLLFDDVSFGSTLETLQNGDFGKWQGREASGQGLPLDWTAAGGWIDVEFNEASRRQIARLRGDGIADAVLTQTTDIRAGKQYDLQVRARPEVVPANDPASRRVDQRARLELQWLADEPIGVPKAIPLDGRDFPLHTWSGTAPAKATRAEVRLIQPRGRGNLLVEAASLAEVDLASVPLIFLGEAPGELTIADLRVVYDLPTSPQDIMPAIRPQTLSARQQLAAIRDILELNDRPQTPLGPSSSVLAEGKIDLMKGVGQQVVNRLADMSPPISTIADLAKLDPEQEIPGIAHERRLELKTWAETLLETGKGANRFAHLVGDSLDALLAESPNELAQRADTTPVQVEQLQRKLLMVRLLLKPTAFHNLHLSDLLPPER